MDASGSRISFHLARALLHVNQLASLINSVFETHEDGDGPPPEQRERGLISWVLPAAAMLPIASSTPSLATHGDIPSRMVTNPEANLRPTLPNNDARDLPHSRGGRTSDVGEAPYQWLDKMTSSRPITS